MTAFVHAAGYMRVAPLGELDADEGAGMWRVHVQAAALLANDIAPCLPAGGRIVLIGSRTATGAAERSQYAATKAALVGMARSWAIELAPRGVTVNVIAPAATDTPMLQDRARGEVTPRTPPIGRFVRPDEVAALTAFGGSGSDHRSAACDLRRIVTVGRTAPIAGAASERNSRHVGPHHRCSRSHQADCIAHPQRVHRLLEDDDESCGSRDRCRAQRATRRRLRLQLQRTVWPGRVDSRALRAAIARGRSGIAARWER